jgi:bifunctional enzyme CysN/CysC
MNNGTPLRVLVVGAGTQASALRAAIASSGQGGSIEVIGEAGRVSPSVLSALSRANVALVAATRGMGLSAEARRECLLAWSVGATPVLGVDSGGVRDQAEVRATGEAFISFAHRLGVPSPLWLDLAADGKRMVEALGRLDGVARPREPGRLWVDKVSSGGGQTRVEGAASGEITPSAAAVVLPSGTSVKVLGSTATGNGRAELTLDGDVEIASGALVAPAAQRPELSDQVAATIAWADDRPLLPGRTYEMRLGPQTVGAKVTTLKHKLNPLDLDAMAARQLADGEVGLVNLSFASAVLSDPFDRSRSLGRFTLHAPGQDTPIAFGRVMFTLRRATNIHWQALSVDKAARAALKGQRPCCLWFTGLSGSGKSTVASLLEKKLNAAGRHTYILDGDNVRHGLNRDLGFTDADRVENIRRVGEVARLFVDAGLIVIVSFISPFRAERKMARDLLPAGDFLEIFVDTPLAICERRDAKGLYKKARAGGLKNFTGIDSPYEAPENPEIRLPGGEASPEDLVDRVLAELARRGMV